MKSVCAILLLSPRYAVGYAPTGISVQSAVTSTEADRKTVVCLEDRTDGTVVCYDLTALNKSFSLSQNGITRWNANGSEAGVNTFITNLPTKDEYKVYTATPDQLIVDEHSAFPVDFKTPRVSAVTFHSLTATKGFTVHTGNHEYSSVADSGAFAWTEPDLFLTESLSESPVDWKNIIPIVNGIVCYPSIIDGRLYIHEGNALLQYDNTKSKDMGYLNFNTLGTLEFRRLCDSIDGKVTGHTQHLVDNTLNKGKTYPNAANNPVNYGTVVSDDVVVSHTTSDVTLTFRYEEPVDGTPLLCIGGRLLFPDECNIRHYVDEKGYTKFEIVLDTVFIEKSIAGALDYLGITTSNTDTVVSSVDLFLSLLFEDQDRIRDGFATMLDLLSREDAGDAYKSELTVEAEARLLTGRLQSFLVIVKTKYSNQIIRHKTLRELNPGSLFFSQNVEGFLVNGMTGEIHDFVVKELENETLVHFNHRRPLSLTARDSIFNLTHTADALRQHNYARKDHRNVYDTFYHLRDLKNYQMLEWYLTELPPSVPASVIDGGETENPDIDKDAPIIPMIVQKGRVLENKEFVDLEDEGTIDHRILQVSRRPNFSLYVESEDAPTRLNGYYFKDNQNVEMTDRSWSHVPDAQNPHNVTIRYEGGCWIFYDEDNNEELIHSSDCFKTTNPWDTSLDWEYESIKPEDKPTLLAKLIAVRLNYGDKLPTSWYELSELTETLPDTNDSYDYNDTQESWYTLVNRSDKIPDSQVVQNREIYPDDETDEETRVNEPDTLRTRYDYYGIVGEVRQGADGSYYIVGEYNNVVTKNGKIDYSAMGLVETMPSADLDEIIEEQINVPRVKGGQSAYVKGSDGKWPSSIFPLYHVSYKISVTMDIVIMDNTGKYYRSLSPSELTDAIALYNTLNYNRDPDHFKPVTLDGNGNWPDDKFPLADVPWTNDQAESSLIQVLDTTGGFQEVRYGVIEKSLDGENGEYWTVAGKRHWYNYTEVSSKPVSEDVKLVGQPKIPSPMKDVGVYPIAKGTLSAPHGYNLVVIPGQITIDPKPITITARPLSKLYGAMDPQLTYDVDGTIESGVNIIGSLEREEGENVGTYNINIGSLQINSTNYKIVFESNTFTIAQAGITVIADSYTVTWGDSIPKLTYSTIPANADRKQFTGQLESNLPPGRRHVGTYQIFQNTLKSSNYNISSFVHGSITIVPADIYVQATSASAVYREPDQPLRYQTSIPAAIDDFKGALRLVEPEGSRDARGNLKVGVYRIERGTLYSNYGVWVGEIWNKDYDFDYRMEFSDGQYTVAKANALVIAQPTLQLPDEDDVVIDLDFKTVVTNPSGVEAYRDEFKGGLVISGESSSDDRPSTPGPHLMLQTSDKPGYSNVGLSSDCYNINYTPAMYNHVHAGDIPGQSIAVVVKATTEYTRDKVFEHHKSFTVNIVTTDTNTVYNEDTTNAVEETQEFGPNFTMRWIPDDCIDDPSAFLEYLKGELANGRSIHDKIYHHGAAAYNNNTDDPDVRSLVQKLEAPEFTGTLTGSEKALLEGVLFGAKDGAVGVWGPYRFLWRLERSNGGLRTQLICRDNNQTFIDTLENDVQTDTVVQFPVEEASADYPATTTINNQIYICNKAVIMDVSLVRIDVVHHESTLNVESTYGPSYIVTGVSNTDIASPDMLRFYLEDIVGRGGNVYNRIFAASDTARSIGDTVDSMLTQGYQTVLDDGEKLLLDGTLFAYLDGNDDVVVELSLQSGNLVKTELYRGTSNETLHTILSSTVIPAGGTVVLSARTIQDVVAEPTGTRSVPYTLDGETYQNATVNTYSITRKTVTVDNPTYTRVYSVSPRYDEESIHLIATTVAGNTFGYIDWGDGTEPTPITRYPWAEAKTAAAMAEYTHTYATAGYYLVSVTGSVRFCTFGKITDGVPSSEELLRVVGIANCSLNTYEGTLAITKDTTVNGQPSYHSYHVYDKPIGTFADMPNADVLSTFKLGRRISNMTAMFRNSGITNKYKNIVIPASVRNLNYAFYNCKNLVTLDGMFDKLFKASVLSTLADRSILCRNAFWFPTENTHIVSSIPLETILTYQTKLSTYWCDVYGTRFMNAASEGQLLDGLASAMFYNLPYLQEYQYKPNDNRYLPMNLGSIPALNGSSAFAVLAYYTVSGGACTYVNRSFNPTYRETTISLDGEEKTLDVTGLKLDMESYPSILSVLQSKRITYVKGSQRNTYQLEAWLNSRPSGGSILVSVSNHTMMTKKVTLVGKP